MTALAIVLAMGLVCILPKGGDKTKATKTDILEMMDRTLDTLVSNRFTNATVMDIEPLTECSIIEPSPLEEKKTELETRMYECRYRGDKEAVKRLTEEISALDDSLARYYADSAAVTRYHARRVRIISEGRKGTFIQRMNHDETKSTMELCIMDSDTDSLSAEIKEFLNK